VTGVHTPPMRKNFLRFMLLRILPGRLIPSLTVFEVLMLIRRLRKSRPAPVTPRRLVTSAPPSAGPRAPRTVTGPSRDVTPR
jgi:hypothetical protein